MIPIVLHTLSFLLSNLPSCSAQNPLQNRVALNLDSIHLRIISWFIDIANFPFESLHNFQDSPNAVFSIKTYSRIKNDTNPFSRGMHRTSYDLYIHPRLSLLYCFFTSIEDTNLRHLNSLIYHETDQIVLAIETVFIIRSEDSVTKVTIENGSLKRQSPVRNGSCGAAHFLEITKELGQLVNGDFDCLRINMKILSHDPYQPFHVWTDVPPKHFQTDSNHVCGLNQVKVTDRLTALTLLSGCILSNIGRSYNLTYAQSENHKLPTQERTAPSVRTKLVLRRRSVTTAGGLNLQLVESPFLYEPYAFVTVKENPEELGNVLIGVIDFKMWIFLVLVLMLMRISVVGSISTIESLSQPSAGFNLKVE